MLTVYASEADPNWQLQTPSPVAVPWVPNRESADARPDVAVSRKKRGRLPALIERAHGTGPSFPRRHRVRYSKHQRFSRTRLPPVVEAAGGLRRGTASRRGAPAGRKRTFEAPILLGATKRKIRIHDTKSALRFPASMPCGPRRPLFDFRACGVWERRPWRGVFRMPRSSIAPLPPRTCDRAIQKPFTAACRNRI
jgi:hypothetical protein